MLSPPDAFILHVDPAAQWVRDYSPLIEYDGSGIGHGANHVSEIGTGDPSSTIVVVGFDQDMSAAARDVLESRLHQLPGVQYVELGDRWAGEC